MSNGNATALAEAIATTMTAPSFGLSSGKQQCIAQTGTSNRVTSLIWADKLLTGEILPIESPCWRALIVKEGAALGGPL
jgi:hypothetical protein